MAEVQRPVDALSDLGKTWAGIAALATIVLYALGYLSLRSHHTALGIDADLGVFDDRYPFAGARFLVFALALLATWAIPLLMLAAVWHSVRRLRRPRRLSLPDWLGAGLRLVLLALLAFATVRFSHVLLIHDLLLDQHTPPRSWAAGKLVCWLDLDEDGRYLILSFQLLLLLSALTIAWAWHEGRQPSPARRWLGLLLWLLAVVDLMLLPIYHGTFFVGTIARRLEHAPAGVDGLAGDVWLIYRGDAEAVLFARDHARTPQLITIDTAKLDGQPLVGVANISKLLEIEECAHP